MTLVLKQSTAVDILIGPFVDVTDGATAETGESPSVKLSKNGQTLAAKNDITTPVHDADGYYNCELDATDTNTVGTLVVTVAATATALPVRHELQVVEESTYEFLYATGSDPDADVAAILADTNELQTDDIPAAITALNDPTAAAIADAVWDEATVGHTTASTFGAQCATDIDAILADTNELQSDDIPGTIAALNDPTAAAVADAVWDEARSGHTTQGTYGESFYTIISGTVDSTVAPTTTEFEADDITEATADHFIGRVIIFTTGALYGQATDITDYAIATGKGHFTVTALTEAPGNNDQFVII